jgi:PPOX class probable F420-dependent enzyme
VVEFLQQVNPAVMATLRPNGAPHSAATWYDWEDGRALVNMDTSRTRLGYLRRDPQISLTVLKEGDWYQQVTLLGRVVEFRDDTDLADIDRLARRYTGEPYRNRVRARVSAWIQPDRWYAWDASAAAPAPPSTQD